MPFGYFNTGIVMTRDLVPLEPKVQELKFYAPDIGPLFERAHGRRRRPRGAGQLHPGRLSETTRVRGGAGQPAPPRTAHSLC